MNRLAAAICLALLAPVTLARARAQPSETCLTCHGDPSLTMERKGRTVSLRVDVAALAASTHKDLACVDCHAGFNPEEVPHAAKIRPVDCTACHAELAKAHAFHPQMARADGKGTPSGTSCKECHGAHDVAPPKAPGSRLRPAALAETCGRCHGEESRNFVASAHGRAVAQGVAAAPDCLACHAQPITPARAGGQTAEHKINQEKLCLSCHLDDPQVRARMTPTAGFIAAYESSVHGAALLKGNAAAANCVDCHGSHVMRKGFEPAARVNKMHIPETCGACHEEIARQYATSIHAAALQRGNVSAPVCTDCHGEHNILNPQDPRSPVAPANVSAQVCSPCHSSVRLSQKYGIATDRFRTFSDSYHGLALRGGALLVANCASCHGAHDIRSAADPGSSVNKANLMNTCGRCHPGANQRFTIGQVHVAATEPGESVLHWIASLYLVLIVVVVGGMAVHNVADFLRKGRRRLRARLGDEPDEPVGRALYLRMTLSERLQHGTLMASFTLLAVTGFMLRYPEAWWVAGLRRLDAHLFDLRSVLHRIAGVVLAGASLYHLAHLAFTTRGRGFLRDILPRRNDLSDALRVMLYNLGLAREKPRFGRFSYVEKSEYWALVWGTIVMALTGAILWFENTFIGILTKLGWDVARTVHFYEAWLATLAILAWHIYYVIFNPDVYPMNMAWLTGTITEAEMADEHPLELEAIRRSELERALEERARAVAEAPIRAQATAADPADDGVRKGGEHG